MSNRAVLSLCCLPLFWGSVALAQAPSPDAQPPMDQHKMMMHHGEAMSPEAFCADHSAHVAARLAFLETKLNLTEKQRPLWHKWQQWQIDLASKEQAMCQEIHPKAASKPTALEHEAHMEKMLTTKLQGMQASRPALEALYEVLTPEQRTIFDRQPGHRHSGFGMMHH